MKIVVVPVKLDELVKKVTLGDVLMFLDKSHDAKELGKRTIQIKAVRRVEEGFAYESVLFSVAPDGVFTFHRWVHPSLGLSLLPADEWKPKCVIEEPQQAVEHTSEEVLT